MGKRKDISNNIYGNLKALYPTEERTNRGILWYCSCVCGESIKATVWDLNRKHITSCGCLKHQSSVNNGQKGKLNLKLNYVDGTEIESLTSKIRSDNTSGCRGVCLNKGKWVAYIKFKGKHYYLGRSEDKETAISYRKNAEKEIFGEFLEWYNKTKY